MMHGQQNINMWRLYIRRLLCRYVCIIYVYMGERGRRYCVAGIATSLRFGWPRNLVLISVKEKEIYFQVQPTRCNVTQFIYFCEMLYMLQAVPPPIIRSSELSTGCNRRNGPDFGRVFLMLNYTEKPQNTYIQSWTVSEIMASEVWNFVSCYTLTDYQIHIETGRNMWFL